MPQIAVRFSQTELCEAALAYLEPFHPHLSGEILWCGVEGRNSPQRLALALTGLFFEAYEPQSLARFISSRYPDLNPDEQKTLLEKARRLLAQDSLSWGIFAGRDREKRMREAIIKHLTGSGRGRICSGLRKGQAVFDYHGFIRFRCPGYREYLLATLSLAIEEILDQREDQAYYQLMGDFLSRQKSSFPRMHLFLAADGSYNLFNDDGKRLQVVEGGLAAGYEDLLLTGLMMMAPGQLVVHQGGSSSHNVLISSLSGIFNQRLSICQGCHLCQ
ncbi:MAG: putative sporulation protein YtxC [Clostridiales bacterium]|nr:putative sporulation protein YtxC [Clostridiales bacterium]